MICEKCNANVPSDSKFCLSCGTPVSTNDTPAASKPNIFILFLYLGLVIFAWIFKDIFKSGMFTWGLMALVAVVIFIMRYPLVTLLQAIDNWSIMEPFWKIQSIIPPSLRKKMGFIAPFVLAFLLTTPLSMMFNGCGHMIFLVSLPINIIVAHIFLVPIPTKFVT